MTTVTVTVTVRVGDSNPLEVAEALFTPTQPNIYQDLGGILRGIASDIESIPEEGLT